MVLVFARRVGRASWLIPKRAAVAGMPCQATEVDTDAADLGQAVVRTEGLEVRAVGEAMTIKIAHQARFLRRVGRGSRRCPSWFDGRGGRG